MGTSEDTYQPDGIDEALFDVRRPVYNGLLRYSGFDVLNPFVTYIARQVKDKDRNTALDRYRECLLHLAVTPRLYFHPHQDYAPDERLLPDVVARSGFQPFQNNTAEADLGCPSESTADVGG